MEPIVQLRGVHHAFGEGSLRKEVLHGVSAELHPGEIVLLTGPSGSGKTTLLTLAGGLRRVQQGSVRVLGQELAGAGQETLLRTRRKIGFIFQSPNLLDALTAVQNVALALGWGGPISPATANARAREQLERVGLGGHADKFPSQLSGGQRQRVAIARALVVQPQLILADEPTSALDRKTGRDVVDLLQRLAREKGCGILLVTHDHRILDLADRTLALEDGRLVSNARSALEATNQIATGVTQFTRRAGLTRQVAALDEGAFFRFLEESTADLEQLRRTLDSVRAQVASSQFDRLLIATTFKAGQLLGADRVTLFVVDRDARMLRSRVAQSGSEELLQLELSLDRGVAGYVARTGMPMNLPDAYANPMFDRTVDERTGYRTRTLLCVPIRAGGGEVVAVGQLLNKAGGQPFDPGDQRRFEEFLEPLGRMLQNLLVVERGKA